MKKVLSVFAFVSVFSSFALADHPIKVGKPVVDAALYAISEGVLVIDVRQEACDGYVKGAHLISVDEFLTNPEAAVEKVLALVGQDKSLKVVVYCRSGARASKAKAVLEKWGFTNVENFGGVYDYFDPETMEKCN